MSGNSHFSNLHSFELNPENSRNLVFRNILRTYNSDFIDNKNQIKSFWRFLCKTEYHQEIHDVSPEQLLDLSILYCDYYRPKITQFGLFEAILRKIYNQ